MMSNFYSGPEYEHLVRFRDLGTPEPYRASEISCCALSAVGLVSFVVYDSPLLSAGFFLMLLAASFMCVARLFVHREMARYKADVRELEGIVAKPSVYQKEGTVEYLYVAPKDELVGRIERVNDMLEKLGDGSKGGP